MSGYFKKFRKVRRAVRTDSVFVSPDVTAQYAWGIVPFLVPYAGSEFYKKIGAADARELSEKLPDFVSVANRHDSGCSLDKVLFEREEILSAQITAYLMSKENPEKSGEYDAKVQEIIGGAKRNLYIDIPNFLAVLGFITYAYNFPKDDIGGYASAFLCLIGTVEIAKFWFKEKIKEKRAKRVMSYLTASPEETEERIGKYTLSEDAYKAYNKE